MAQSPQQTDAPFPSGPSQVVPQAAALPWRRDGDGTLWILLIRRRHKRRWGIPKGVIDPGLTPAQAALQEAREEAGVAGDLSPGSIGGFTYKKWGLTCHVQVFLLHVTQEYDRYDEETFRERRWFPFVQATAQKTRKGIQPLIAQLPRLVGRTPPTC